MLTAPIVAVRPGQASTDATIVGKLVKSKSSITIGDPVAAFGALAQQGDPPTRWFSVALDKTNKVMAVVFYEAARAKKVRGVIITGIAVHAHVHETVLPGVVGDLIGAVVHAAGQRQRGYVAVDADGQHDAGLIQMLDHNGWEVLGQTAAGKTRSVVFF